MHKRDQIHFLKCLVSTKSSTYSLLQEEWRSLHVFGYGRYEKKLMPPLREQNSSFFAHMQGFLVETPGNNSRTLSPFSLQNFPVCLQSRLYFKSGKHVEYRTKR